MKATTNFLTIFLLLISTNGWCLDLTRFDSKTLYSSLETDKTISMDFKDAELNNVLKLFSQQSGLNFIAASDISAKKINLYLDKVPVEEALEKILSANNLTYELKPDSNIFIVKQLVTPAKDLLTRVYQLKHATVSNSPLKTQLEDTEDSAGGASSSSSSSSSTASEDDEETGIIDAIKAILSQDGSVIEDTRTNSLIVTDIPSQFPRIEQAIARLDVRVPQVLIEVEMLDIAKGTGDALGAKWGDTPFTFTGAERDDVIPFDTGALLERGYTFEDPQYRVSTASFRGLNVALQFLRTQTDTRSLARPRILTLNNQTAEINITTDEAIGITTSESEVAGSTDQTTEAERTQTGISLKVTPQANVQTGEIVMAIEPKVIDAQQSTEFPSFKDPEERGTKSLLRIMDGDTVIMAGLLRTESSTQKTRVPFLANVPLVGSAFRHKEKNESERELVIFITPHIVKERLPNFTSLANNKSLVREQTIPETKMNEVNQTLSAFEKN